MKKIHVSAASEAYHKLVKSTPPLEYGVIIPKDEVRGALLHHEWWAVWKPTIEEAVAAYESLTKLDTLIDVTDAVCQFDDAEFVFLLEEGIDYDPQEINQFSIRYAINPRR